MEGVISLNNLMTSWRSDVDDDDDVGDVVAGIVDNDDKSSNTKMLITMTIFIIINIKITINHTPLIIEDTINN